MNGWIIFLRMNELNILVLDLLVIGVVLHTCNQLSLLGSTLPLNMHNFPSQFEFRLTTFISFLVYLNIGVVVVFGPRPNIRSWAGSLPKDFPFSHQKLDVIYRPN